MKTIAEMADNIGIPHSTARGFVRRFSQFFSAKHVKSQRWPVYEDEAEEVLRDIATASKQMLSYDAIAEFLSKKYPINADSDDVSTQRAQQHDVMTTAQQQHPSQLASSLSDNTMMTTTNLLLDHISRQNELIQKQTEAILRLVEVIERREENREVVKPQKVEVEPPLKTDVEQEESKPAPKPKPKAKPEKKKGLFGWLRKK